VLPQHHRKNLCKIGFSYVGGMACVQSQPWPASQQSATQPSQPASQPTSQPASGQPTHPPKAAARLQYSSLEAQCKHRKLCEKDFSIIKFASCAWGACGAQAFVATRGCLEPQGAPNGRSRLRRSRRGARTGCSSLPRNRRGARNGFSGLARTRGNVRNGCSRLL